MTTKITIFDNSVIMLVIPHCLIAVTSLSNFSSISLNSVLLKNQS